MIDECSDARVDYSEKGIPTISPYMVCVSFGKGNCNSIACVDYLLLEGFPLKIVHIGICHFH